MQHFILPCLNHYISLSYKALYSLATEAIEAETKAVRGIIMKCETTRREQKSCFDSQSPLFCQTSSLCRYRGATLKLGDGGEGLTSFSAKCVC